MSRYSLDTYNQKRDFEKTPEPAGKKAKAGKKLSFVIQKHAATRLHYDFRLEMEGVLKSWAIPKGPSLDPKDKRLAVRTEDHPISYGDFEGVIPVHQYGAGAVIIWDEGTWQPEDKNPVAALKKGKISFTLKGHKLNGSWTLARMGGKRNKDKENWLLIKGKDEQAQSNKGFMEKTSFSVKSGMDLKEISANGKIYKPAPKPKEKTNKMAIQHIKALAKQYSKPQLATLVDKPPEGKKWLHEVKYDGYRILAYVEGSDVRIFTRNGHDWTEKFPVLTEALAAMDLDDAILDGEAVMLDDKGLSDFKRLQNSLDDPDAAMRAYFFDLLYHKGKDCRKLSLRKRRETLEKLLASKNHEAIYLSDVFEENASEVIDQACQLGLEGIISKDITAKYQSGRSKSWLKSKCIKRQEFIICGFIEASDHPKAVGALHLGYYKNKKLQYAGKVGTGFDHKSAEMLYQKLMPLKRKTAPFSSKISGSYKQTVWVTPELLCEVKFSTWTSTGKVRHASYQGLREDKAPKEIDKEDPKPVKNVSKKKIGSTLFTVANTTISHPDRMIFPQAELTKGELAEFYFEMAEYIMPQLEDRLISVVRCPGGITKQCFFQRGKGKGMPKHIFTMDVKHKNKTSDYMYIKNIQGLVELVQMGGIEIHGWGSRIDKIDQPDRIVFDLDPSEDVPFEAVKLAAKDVKQRLEDVGLISFLKATGGKGLHVTAPIRRTRNWEEVKTFARQLAEKMEEQVPQAYTTNMSKKKRKGKIFIDYLRNDHASTAVMDYCVRSRPGAPVAAPLAWEELNPLKTANQFHIADILQRKKQAAELLKFYFAVQQTLTNANLEKYFHDS